GASLSPEGEGAAPAASRAGPGRLDRRPPRWHRPGPGRGARRHPRVRTDRCGPAGYHGVAGALRRSSAVPPLSEPATPPGPACSPRPRRRRPRPAPRLRRHAPAMPYADPLPRRWRHRNHRDVGCEEGHVTACVRPCEARGQATGGAGRREAGGPAAPGSPDRPPPARLALLLVLLFVVAPPAQLARPLQVG